MSQSDLMTLQQVADEAGVHVQTVRGWIKRGTLLCHRNGAWIRVSRTQWQAALEAWTVGTLPAEQAQDGHENVLALPPAKRLCWNGIKA